MVSFFCLPKIAIQSSLIVFSVEGLEEKEALTARGAGLVNDVVAKGLDNDLRRQEDQEVLCGQPVHDKEPELGRNNPLEDKERPLNAPFFLPSVSPTSPGDGAQGKVTHEDFCGSKSYTTQWLAESRISLMEPSCRWRTLKFVRR
jgi:hypothetical protein